MHGEVLGEVLSGEGTCRGSTSLSLSLPILPAFGVHQETEYTCSVNQGTARKPPSDFV